MNGSRRRLCLDRWKSDAFRALVSLLAGCSFATSILRVVLAQTVDAMLRCWQSVKTYVVVDDITLVVYGRLKQIETIILGATRMLCRLSEELGLKVSLTKGQVLATDAPAGKRLASRLAEWDFRYVREARNSAWIT